MATICTDNFTLSVVVTLRCTVAIKDKDAINDKSYTYGDSVIMITFGYILGSDVEVDHSAYGFSMHTFPALLPVGISFSEPRFVPDAPDLSGNLTDVKEATMTTTLTVVKPSDPPDPMQDPPPYVGTSKLSVDIFIQLNTGKTPD